MFRLSTLGAMFAMAGSMFATLGCTHQPDDMRAFVAVAGRYSLMAAESRPDKNEVCKNCGGTGRVGDGKIFVPCPVCQPNGGQPCLTGTCATRR